ncbi:Signal transduction histidine kinase [Micromonospora purpureochromogenes]|uniref:histidine kinase n=1 Tax=Micromonospora purpureochromogenes TaxID=47872 RepID=A0A1C4YWM6_9ACTN|nr:sensor histidine kinase [Micromonospora purpureochromogenes]SCF25145.1 Signal transduction histidine kinase [Micromonospora purpureochromogenes]
MTDGPARWWQRRPLAGDALFAAALVLLEIAFLLLTPPEFWPGRMPGALAWSLLAAAPVALRRVAPWTAVSLAVATLMLPVLLKLAPGTQGLAFMVLTYTMAAHRPARQAALAAVLLWVPVGVTNLVAPPEGVLAVGPGYLLLNNLLIALLSYAVGRAVQARRTSVRALRERARVAEENQRSLAEQAVADERRRIARELHDVVAHHVSVMGVLATGARRVLRRDPDAADEAIATIEDTSRVTLREMRRLLDVLRTDAEPAADLTPQPGLAGIEALVEQVREAGLPVTLHVEGTPGPVEEGVSLTVYRIVQEALTNALKHAGEATAQVRLTVADGWLTVEVTDTGRGPGPGPDRIGHGLVGMRERVGLYGGTLRTGPRPGGGFRVSARIPVESVGAAA